MIKRLTILLMPVVWATAMMADTKQTVTVNGSTVDKTVSRMTFDGDKVVMTFTDNTAQTEDMEAVTISFLYSGTGVGKVKADEMKDKRVFNLNGQYLGKGVEGRAKGVYVVDGKKVVVQ